MAKLKIVKFGDPILRKVSRPVEEITPRILTLLDDMIDTMREAGGCGLAAVQVGVLRRIAVIEVEPGEVYELINPKIIVCLGRIAAMTHIKSDFKITREQGQWFEDTNGRKLMAIFHPEGLLRDPRRRPETFEALKRLQAEIRSSCDHTYPSGTEI